MHSASPIRCGDTTAVALHCPGVSDSRTTPRRSFRRQSASRCPSRMQSRGCRWPNVEPQFLADFNRRRPVGEKIDNTPFLHLVVCTAKQRIRVYRFDLIAIPAKKRQRAQHPAVARPSGQKKRRTQAKHHASSHRYSGSTQSELLSRADWLNIYRSSAMNPPPRRSPLLLAPSSDDFVVPVQPPARVPAPRAFYQWRARQDLNL